MMAFWKKGWVVVFIFLFPFFLSAQSESLSSEGSHPATQLRGTVKLSMLDMIDPFGPVFALAFEQKLANRVSVQLEGGYLSTFDGSYFLRRDLEGYKVRGELRFYDRDGFNLEGVSYGLQVVYKYDTANENDNFLRSGNFFQNIDYDIEREVIAGHFVTNTMFPFEGKSFLEISGWIGLRRLVRTHEGVPDDAELVIDRGSIISRNPGTFVRPSFGLAIRLGLGW